MTLRTYSELCMGERSHRVKRDTSAVGKVLKQNHIFSSLANRRCDVKTASRPGIAIAGSYEIAFQRNIGFANRVNPQFEPQANCVIRNHRCVLITPVKQLILCRICCRRIGNCSVFILCRCEAAFRCAATPCRVLVNTQGLIGRRRSLLCSTSCRRYYRADGKHTGQQADSQQHADNFFCHFHVLNLSFV